MTFAIAVQRFGAILWKNAVIFVNGGVMFVNAVVSVSSNLKNIFGAKFQMFHFEKIEFSRTILSFSKSFANVMTKIVIFLNFILI